MDEYMSREAVLNLIEHNDKVCHYKDERYENVVYATTQTICKVVAEMPAADVQPVSQWISVGDKLPIEQGPVLCYARSTTGEGNCRILGTLRNGEFWFLQVDGTQLSFPCLQLKVTHWMPLPDPPVDGGNEDENT